MIQSRIVYGLEALARLAISQGQVERAVFAAAWDEGHALAEEDREQVVVYAMREVEE